MKDRLLIVTFQPSLTLKKITGLNLTLIHSPMCGVLNFVSCTPSLDMCGLIICLTQL
jgi:hypothetical protein